MAVDDDIGHLVGNRRSPRKQNKIERRSYSRERSLEARKEKANKRRPQSEHKYENQQPQQRQQQQPRHQQQQQQQQQQRQPRQYISTSYHEDRRFDSPTRRERNEWKRTNRRKTSVSRVSAADRLGISRTSGGDSPWPGCQRSRSFDNLRTNGSPRSPSLRPAGIPGLQNRANTQVEIPLNRMDPQGGAGSDVECDDDAGSMSEAETSATEGAYAASIRRGSRLRSSLPIVRSPSKTLERPLGLVFLMLGGECRRAQLPNEITSMDTVRALFVRAFHDRLSFAYMEQECVKIYIRDPVKDLFYELEALSEITDRTILKLFEIDQVTGAPKTALGGHDVRESGGLGPGNKGEPGSQYASMSTIADGGDLGSTKADGMEIKHLKHPGGHKGALDVDSPAHGGMQQNLMGHGGLMSGRHGQMIPMQQMMVSPHSPTRDHAPNTYQSPYHTMGRGSTLPNASPTHRVDGGTLTRQPRMRTQQGTQTGAQSGARGGSSPNRIVIPGSAQSNLNRQLSGNRGDGNASSGEDEIIYDKVRMNCMEKQLESLTGLVHTAIIQGTLTRQQGKEIAASIKAAGFRVGDFNPASEESLAESGVESGPGPGALKSNSSGDAKPRTQSSDTQTSAAATGSVPSDSLSASVKEFRLRVVELKTDIRQLRRMQEANAQTMREFVLEAHAKIKRAVEQVATGEGFDGAVDPLRLQRLQANLHQKMYLGDMKRVDEELKELEESVEILRADVINRRSKVNMSDVEAMAVALSKITSALSELRAAFPMLHQKLRSVMTSEMEQVMTEEKFMKEEPERLETALRRCKKLTGTLFTLKRDYFEKTETPLTGRAFPASEGETTEVERGGTQEKERREEKREKKKGSRKYGEKKEKKRKGERKIGRTERELEEELETRDKDDDDDHDDDHDEVFRIQVIRPESHFSHFAQTDPVSNPNTEIFL